MAVFIGCAGWSIPSPFASQFAGGGTHLQRYARRLSGVEINSSFYRPHMPKTYARWAESTPDHFRFAVKTPKQITHERRLKDVEPLLDRFVEEASSLGPKLGPLLVQLPPSLKLTVASAEKFFQQIRERVQTPVVCEPRHATWFTSEGERLLEQYRIARVAADPAPVPAAAEPAGWSGLQYFRLHGSPKMYYSAYSDESLAELAQRLAGFRDDVAEAWCIFDNTAEGAAYGNALALMEQLHPDA